MERLCGRPGCSEPASVAYGMQPTDLVFWLAALPLDPAPDGVLCRRHADSMVVPKGWTLDDRRDPDLHLFRPPPPVPHGPTTRRMRRGSPPGGEQLDLDLGPEAAADVPVESAGGPSTTDADDPDAAPAPWSPTFDEADDLDGLLTARSPLLARAFRTAERSEH